MAPQTVTPPPETCAKCGWPLGYVPNHLRYQCNPVGGKEADDLSSHLQGVSPPIRATKSGHGQDTLTVIFENGSTVVLLVSKEGRFSVDTTRMHLVGDHGVEGAKRICRLFAEICEVR